MQLGHLIVDTINYDLSYILKDKPAEYLIKENRQTYN